MTEKTIKFRDPVVERVVTKFVGRSDVGYKKYGVTLEEDQSRIFDCLSKQSLSKLKAGISS